MDESEIASGAPPMIRAMAPGMASAFGTLLRGGQDRKNLEADRAFIDGLFKSGFSNFRYRGLAMDLETFADAQQTEAERLLTNTLNAIEKADTVVDWSKINLDQFNPEFRRRWILEASNVSDETLQGLWARLLAGELESPGSVSNDTMSLARVLNKDRAVEFQTFCSAALCSKDGTPIIVLGCGNPGANTLQPYGLSYEVLLRLAHHRLIVNDMTSYTDRGVNPSQPTIAIRQQELMWLLSWSNENTPPPATLRLKGVLFTPAGKELYPVVQKTPLPAYTAAMLKTLEQPGWKLTPL